MLDPFPSLVILLGFSQLAWIYRVGMFSLGFGLISITNTV
jgi:hypothetical protein